MPLADRIGVSKIAGVLIIDHAAKLVNFHPAPSFEGPMGIVSFSYLDKVAPTIFVQTAATTLSDLDRTILVGSTIRLAASRPEAQPRLDNYGHWWSVLSGNDSSTGKASDQWYLQSNRLGKQPKKKKLGEVDVMRFPKISANSPDYRLLQVVPGECNFNYKKHHDGSIA